MPNAFIKVRDIVTEAVHDNSTPDKDTSQLHLNSLPELVATIN